MYKYTFMCLMCSMCTADTLFALLHIASLAHFSIFCLRSLLRHFHAPTSSLRLAICRVTPMPASKPPTVAIKNEVIEVAVQQVERLARRQACSKYIEAVGDD